MSKVNVRPSDRFSLKAKLDPVSQSAATVTTGWIAMTDLAWVLAVLQVGALGSSATVNAKLQQAKDGSGTDAKDITGKAITQLTQAGSDANKQALINCFAEELDVNAGFTHVRLSVTVATAACLISAAVYGVDARYAPAAHAASVAEVVG